MQRPDKTDLFTTVVMAHPRRAEAAYRLARSIGPSVRIIFDPDPNGPPSSSRTAARAWRYCDATVSHHLVVQDDVMALPSLVESVNRAIAAHPTAALAFYANSNSWHGAAARAALLAGYRWVSWVPQEYFPTVATVLPCDIAHEFAELAERQNAEDGDADGKDDDEVMRFYLASKEHPALVRTSALVEHRATPSIMGYDIAGIRRSVCLAEPDEFSDTEQRCLWELTAWPNFAYRRALLRMPSTHSRTGLRTRTRANHLMTVSLTWDDVCALSDELWRELPKIPERNARARRYLRELCLASYTLGWALAAIQGPVVKPLSWPPAADASLRSYAEGGLAYQSAVDLWADQSDIVINFMWRVLEIGRTRACLFNPTSARGISQ